jgi:hypothetical protein
MAGDTFAHGNLPNSKHRKVLNNLNVLRKNSVVYERIIAVTTAFCVLVLSPLSFIVYGSFLVSMVFGLVCLVLAAYTFIAHRRKVRDIVRNYVWDFGFTNLDNAVTDLKKEAAPCAEELIHFVNYYFSGTRF